MEHAKNQLDRRAEAYNINLTNDHLNTFIEAAVKKPMNNGRNEVQKW